MLLAAGLGTRLRPLTERTPKPLVQVAGRPLMDYALERFAAHGLARVVVNTHHLADQVAAHVAQRRAAGYGPALHISPEPTLLDSGGGVVQALPRLAASHFFTANADAIWLDGGGQPALARLCQAFDAARMDALLLLHPLARAVGYHGPGNFDLTAAGQLRRGGGDERYVFTGLCLWSRRAFHGRKAEPFSLRALFDAARAPDGTLRRMFGLVHTGDWLHVGSPRELAEAEAFLAARPAL